MSAPRTARTVAASALAAAAAVLLAASATGQAGQQKITSKGVGAVKLGATAASLQDRGLIGRLVTGCELAGPGTRAANLKRPLRGTVNLTMTNPRKVDAITINGGATARGVAVGDRTADIRRAYPGAKVDRSLRDTFGGDFVRVPRKSGGRLEFFVNADSGRIETIGVPHIPLCE